MPRLLVVLLISLRVWAGGAHAQTAHFSEAQATVPVVDLDNPTGMAVDASGNIYIADNSSNLLWKYTLSGPVAGGGYFYNGEGNPYGIALDGAGNLYFIDSISNQIVKETIFPNGTGTRTVLPIAGLSSPRGIAVDTQGNLYIADYGNNRVVEATPSGSTYTQRTVPTSSLSMPEAVAVDGSGNLYVADTLHLRVLKETLSGNIWSESVVANLADRGSERPVSITSDGVGDVFVLDYGNGSYDVLKETPSRGAYTQTSIPSFGQYPYAIAASAAGDVHMVSPLSNRLLEQFGPTTSFGAVSGGARVQPFR